MLVFSLLGILRAAYFTYTIACLSTIEKRYAFPSKISAIILICDNISGLLLNPVNSIVFGFWKLYFLYFSFKIVGYLGTRVNGPRLIGCGVILIAFSSLLSGMPYFIYGPSKALYETSGPFDTGSLALNKTKFEFCDGQYDDCLDNAHSFNFGAFLILAGASFLNGNLLNY